VGIYNFWGGKRFVGYCVQMHYRVW
jgi:hypothetical protein